MFRLYQPHQVLQDFHLWTFYFNGRLHKCYINERFPQNKEKVKKVYQFYQSTCAILNYNFFLHVKLNYVVWFHQKIKRRSTQWRGNHAIIVGVQFECLERWDHFSTWVVQYCISWFHWSRLIIEANRYSMTPELDVCCTFAVQDEHRYFPKVFLSEKEQLNPDYLRYDIHTTWLPLFRKGYSKTIK